MRPAAFGRASSALRKTRSLTPTEWERVIGFCSVGSYGGEPGASCCWSICPGQSKVVGAFDLSFALNG